MEDTGIDRTRIVRVVYMTDTAPHIPMGWFTTEAVIDPDWVPDDAAAIIVRTSTGHDAGIVADLLASDSTVPDFRRQAERRSASMVDIDGNRDNCQAAIRGKVTVGG